MWRSVKWSEGHRHGFHAGGSAVVRGGLEPDEKLRQCYSNLFRSSWCARYVAPEFEEFMGEVLVHAPRPIAAHF